MRTQKTLSEQLRNAIRRDGRSLYALAVDSGVDRGVLVRFMNGDREPTLPTADRICCVLGLELRPARREAKG
jgi:DNA-binding phage protein